MGSDNEPGGEKEEVEEEEEEVRYRSCSRLFAGYLGRRAAKPSASP